ncbi:MAG TPA: PilZ domain-containing protein [Devosiaceae bacterium]|nr:PilZ domain-containing protein [Devosiaceae bacterium]
MDIRLEKRLSPRRNTMIEARIAFDGGRSKVDCLIRNLSDGGAKLEVASVKAIPNSFDLIAPGHRPHACRVVWRALKEMGVEFRF